MSSEAAKTFADRLLDLVAESKLTMKELGEKIGVSPASLSKYQNAIDEPGISALSKIKRYFNVSADWLLGFSKTRNPVHGDMAKELGLSSKAVEILTGFKENLSERLPELRVISSLIEHGDTGDLLKLLHNYGFGSYVFINEDEAEALRRGEDVGIHSGVYIAHTYGGLHLKAPERIDESKLNSLSFFYIQMALMEWKRAVDEAEAAEFEAFRKSPEWIAFEAEAQKDADLLLRALMEPIDGAGVGTGGGANNV